ncbi:MAG: hypothetical protein JXR49_02580 [Acidobacteria bacterium]|nr:hypothetical protein [Acidobacteriota bacterium]
MSFLSNVLGGGVGKLVKDVVGTFKLSPEAKQEFEKAIENHQHEIQMKEYELTVKAMETEKATIAEASANIRAEAQSGDKMVSRARPTFLYLFYIILAFNFVVLPLAQMIGGVAVTDLKPIDFPDILWEVFIAGYLGYVGAREFGKYKRTK